MAWWRRNPCRLAAAAAVAVAAGSSAQSMKAVKAGVRQRSNARGGGGIDAGTALPPRSRRCLPAVVVVVVVVVVVLLLGVGGVLLLYHHGPAQATLVGTSDDVQYWSPRVLNTYGHDKSAFLQGIEYDSSANDVMFESTGLYGKSVVRRWNLQSGEVLQETNLDAELFGEGLTLVDDELFVLTWKENVVLVFDRTTLSEKRRLTLNTDGWGICSLGNGEVAVTDGSSTLFFYNAETMELRRSVQVTMPSAQGRKPVRNLNELEFIDGKIFMNVWFSRVILVVDPLSGNVEHVLRLDHVVAQAVSTNDRDAVLNGIAFDANKRRLFVSGKLWPSLYHIEMPSL